MRPAEHTLPSSAPQHMLKKTAGAKKKGAIKSDLFSFKINKLHPHFSHSELPHDSCTSPEEAALQGGIYNLQMKPLPGSETSVPSWSCQNAQTGWPDSSPTGYLLLLTQTVQLSSMHLILTTVSQGSMRLLCLLKYFQVNI